jgi:putative alpha-1,2-mannosidase
MLLASPIFPRAVVDRGTGVKLVINAPAASATNRYVQTVRLNGVQYDKSWLPESFVRNGGTITFALGPDANQHWATATNQLPRDLLPIPDAQVGATTPDSREAAPSTRQPG